MTATAPSYAEVAEDFQRDGSLRDIYVLSCSVSHWERAIGYVARRYENVGFSGAFSGPGLPPDVAALFRKGPDSEGTSMFVDVDGVQLNCHFFTPDEIEFDLDPRQLTGDARLAAVIDFMKGLASAVGRDVTLTHENVRSAVILRYRPGANRVERR